MLSPSNSIQIPKTKNSAEKFEELEHKLQSVHTPFLVEPNKENIPANQIENTPIIYVNGMNMAPDAILSSALKLANIYGRPTYVIPNDKEKSRIEDLANGIYSLFSKDSGLKAEPQATKHLLAVLHSRLSDDKPVHLFGFSQGTLIIKDSLWQLHEELKEQGKLALWSHFASRVRLTTTAAATRNFPPGIAVTENLHSRDPIGIVAASSQKLHSIAGYKDSKAPSVATISNNKETLYESFSQAHSVDEYLNNTNQFFLKRISDLDCKTQARLIIASISKGEFNDSNYQNLIELISRPITQPNEALSEQERFEAQSRSKQIAMHILKDAPNGVVGKFQIANSELKSLETAAKAIVKAVPTPKKSGSILGYFRNLFS